MEMAIEDMGDPVAVWKAEFAKLPWPRFETYDHMLELGYQETAGYKVGKEAAIAAIKRRLG
jgi:hypothetical protein